jgi:hypothetical protein
MVIKYYRTNTGGTVAPFHDPRNTLLSAPNRLESE